jgi:5-(aminomethyl)-3-furanmethanol phosphate kinase
MVPVNSEPSATPQRDQENPSPPGGAPAQAGPLVVKIGGGLLGLPGALARVGAVLGRVAARRPLVVIPGGGPFAEAVRSFEREYGLSPTAAHWMAILGMDQYAQAIADYTPDSRVVDDRAGVQAAHASGAIPILAPFRWLRAADELPHSWEVTSDSLAAYLATLLGAEELVLVKPVAGGDELTDPYFRRALAAGMRWRVVSARTDELEAALTR